MDTALKPNKERRFLSYSKRLFLSVISLFLIFAGCFIAYQYQREKEYKVELLDVQLQDCNDRLHRELHLLPDSLWRQAIEGYIVRYINEDMRVTIIDRQGVVLFDNYRPGYPLGLENHLNRPEIQKALSLGKGHDVRRTSETTGIPYFYSATAYDDCIVRSALPYTVNLINNLSVDPHYLWFTIGITLALIFIFYTFVSKLGTAINQLREFAKRADKNEPIDIDSTFPHNELGEISQHIVQIYKRLRETKEDLYIEREKLITHLQTSREGLGVFTKDKKEILVNNLFTQYGNIISDSNLETTEDIFSIDEFKSITDFINKAKRWDYKEEKRMSISINKNGRVFVVECIIFQDLSFEISINDITQEEEQVRLKRQLTQNIAHELKTPVSSIQGYLETIVDNENLPREKMQLTRMDEAANMIEMEKVDISLLVTNMVNEVALELEQRQITVVNSLRPKIQLRGNYSLLYSIFRNLMDNAIAYAGTHICIDIKCFREDDNFFYFSFSDTGVGVPPEHLNRLFERFYRVDKGRSRKLGGTGLGLAIVKNAVLIHGGTISAKNRHHSCRLVRVHTCRLVRVRTCRLVGVRTCRLVRVRTCRLVRVRTCRLVRVRTTVAKQTSYPATDLPTRRNALFPCLCRRF